MTAFEDPIAEPPWVPEAFNLAEVRELLLNALARDSVDELKLPHAVVCTDPSTGCVSYSGPYEDGLAALCAADRDHQNEQLHDPDTQMVFSVVPLLRPSHVCSAVEVHPPAIPGYETT